MAKGSVRQVHLHRLRLALLLRRHRHRGHLLLHQLRASGRKGGHHHHHLLHPPVETAKKRRRQCRKGDATTKRASHRTSRTRIAINKSNGQRRCEVCLPNMGLLPEAKVRQILLLSSIFFVIITCVYRGRRAGD